MVLPDILFILMILSAHFLLKMIPTPLTCMLLSLLQEEMDLSFDEFKALPAETAYKIFLDMKEQLVINRKILASFDNNPRLKTTVPPNHDCEQKPKIYNINANQAGNPSKVGAFNEGIKPIMPGWTQHLLIGDSLIRKIDSKSVSARDFAVCGLSGITISQLNQKIASNMNKSLKSVTLCVGLYDVLRAPVDVFKSTEKVQQEAESIVKRLSELVETVKLQYSPDTITVIGLPLIQHSRVTLAKAVNKELSRLKSYNVLAFPQSDFASDGIHLADSGIVNLVKSLRELFKDGIMDTVNDSLEIKPWSARKEASSSQDLAVLLQSVLKSLDGGRGKHVHNY